MSLSCLSWVSSACSEFFLLDLSLFCLSSAYLACLFFWTSSVCLLVLSLSCLSASAWLESLLIVLRLICLSWVFPACLLELILSCLSVGFEPLLLACLSRVSLACLESWTAFACLHIFRLSCLSACRESLLLVCLTFISPACRLLLVMSLFCLSAACLEPLLLVLSLSCFPWVFPACLLVYLLAGWVCSFTRTMVKVRWQLWSGQVCLLNLLLWMCGGGRMHYLFPLMSERYPYLNDVRACMRAWVSCVCGMRVCALV